MKRSKFREEQVVGILREAQGGMTVKTVCAKHNLSAATYHKWRQRYGGNNPVEVQRSRTGGAERHFEGGKRKKVVSPSSKRRTVKYVEEEGAGRKAQACRALGLARSGAYRLPKQSAESRCLQKQIVKLSEDNPRYGYRRITVLLRRQKQKVNFKRVQRIRRLGQSTGLRQKADRRNQVWSWDFVSDQLENGSPVRLLTLIDEHTRQCLAIHAAWSIRAVDVITVVEAAMERYGMPGHIRSDNGPESIGYAIKDWLEGKKIKTIYIKPGAPWENGHIESFHDKFRDELLNRELFGSLLEAKVPTEQWRIE